MTDGFEIRPIARIRTDFREKFGIPRQSGVAASALGRIVFEPEFRSAEALRGIEGFSHLWLIWQFSQSLRQSFTPTVRPPKLGGNARMGVFATRSPFRPNSLGLSSVRLEAVEDGGAEGTVLIVSGADMLDGTPIFDIKPYLAYTDSHPDAREGFAAPAWATLRVEAPPELAALIPPALREVLENDPRPQYQSDPERVYGLSYGDMEVRFRVEGEILRIIEITRR